MKRLPRKFSILTANIPVSFFGMILGLVGLGNCWRVATKIWHLPSWIGEMIMLIAVVVWLVLILAYIGKWLWVRADALAEFSHPILCCFVGLVPVSTVLVALAIDPYSREIAVGLFAVGAIGQLGFGVYRSGRLWMGGRSPEMTTPILYLPTVAGSFVSAIVASALGYRDWGMLFFWGGAVFMVGTGIDRDESLIPIGSLAQTFAFNLGNSTGSTHRRLCCLLGYY